MSPKPARPVPAEPSGDAAELHDAPPDAERLISDVETLRALSDPLRLRMLESMVQRIDPPWTVKELASTLKVPTTRLYHHVDLLLERDLIRPVERRVVSGIIETRYRVAARSLRLDKRLFQGGSPESDAAVHGVLLSLFDGSRDEVEAALRTHLVETAEDAAPEKRLLLSKGFARLPIPRAIEFRERLLALLKEYEEAEDTTGPDGAEFGLFVAFYPFAHPDHTADGGDD